MKFIEPMLAKLVETLPEGRSSNMRSNSTGIEASPSAMTRSGLLSRRNNVLNDRFRKIAKALEAIEPGTILDGELVALDEHGRPSFNLLQNYRPARPTCITTYSTCCLSPQEPAGLAAARSACLAARQRAPRRPRPNPLLRKLQASADDLIRAAREQGLEGIIAKRATSVYEPGKRSARGPSTK